MTRNSIDNSSLKQSILVHSYLTRFSLPADEKPSNTHVSPKFNSLLKPFDCSLVYVTIADQSNAMNLKRRLLLAGTLFLLSYLFISNPTESTYLSRVLDDYARYHENMDISVEMLQEIGESHRTTYFFFSTYDYRFADMKVFYFGVANSIYYVRLHRDDDKEGPVKFVEVMSDADQMI